MDLDDKEIVINGHDIKQESQEIYDKLATVLKSIVDDQLDYHEYSVMAGLFKSAVTCISAMGSIEDDTTFAKTVAGLVNAVWLARVEAKNPKNEQVH